MSKYDCSKTLDYLHEMGRMCGLQKPESSGFGQCSYCPAKKLCNTIIMHGPLEITDNCIAAIQQWSDTHPEPESAPERDLIEVVRCKDCLHPSKYVDESGVEKQFCSTWMRFCDPDGYCSSGKRRHAVTSPAEIKED